MSLSTCTRTMRHKILCLSATQSLSVKVAAAKSIFVSISTSCCPKHNMFQLKVASFAIFGLFLLLAKVKADCQTIDIFYKSGDKLPDFMADCELSEPGSQCFGNLPFFSKKNGDKIGQLRYLLTAIPGKTTSKNGGGVAFIGSNVMTFLDGSGQITYTTDAFSSYKEPHQYVITGGTGDFACAGGVIHLNGGDPNDANDDAKTYRKIEVCTSCKL